MRSATSRSLAMLGAIGAALFLLLPAGGQPPAFVAPQVRQAPADPSVAVECESRGSAPAREPVLLAVDTATGLAHDVEIEPDVQPQDDRESVGPRRRALLARPEGTVTIEVVDSESGERIPSFRYLLEGPGVARRRGIGRDGRAAVPIRTGMPANLRVEAEGFAGRWRRQILLRAGAPARNLRIALERAVRGS